MIKMKILFFGDIVGRAARRSLPRAIAECKKEDPEISLVIANGENAAHGMGITKGVLDEILEAGVDLVTLGDHTWDIKGVDDLLNREEIPLICPANFPKLTLDKGWRILDVEGEKVLVINLIGRVFMKICPDCPLRAVDEILKKCENKAKVVIVDFHAETTSEKNALGRYLAGRVSAVLGTHTHIQTADDKILDGGTAYITDVGMVGPLDSIIQVAGRINRNDRDGFKNSPLYVVNFENDAQRVYGRIIINASFKIINSNKEYFLEREYLNLIQEYYNLITKEESTSFDESRKLYDAMQKLRFTKDEYEEETVVEDFKLIDDNKAHYSDVFIPITKNASSVLNIYKNEYLKCESMNKKKQIYLKIKSAFNQYKLSVPNRIINYLVSNSNGIEQLIESKLYMINQGYIGTYDDKKHNILYNYE